MSDLAGGRPWTPMALLHLPLAQVRRTQPSPCRPPSGGARMHTDRQLLLTTKCRPPTNRQPSTDRRPRSTSTRTPLSTAACVPCRSAPARWGIQLNCAAHALRTCMQSKFCGAHAIARMHACMHAVQRAHQRPPPHTHSLKAGGPPQTLVHCLTARTRCVHAGRLDGRACPCPGSCQGIA